MGRYRKVDPRIWNDAKFRQLSDKGKLAFLFLLTHPHMTMLGAMRESIPGLAAELGWPEKAFREAFEEASRKAMVKADLDASFIWLPNFLKYNRPESPNVVKSWAECLELLPECRTKHELIQHVKDFVEGLTEGFRKDLPEAFRKALPYQEQEQEQEQEQDKEKHMSAEPTTAPKILLEIFEAENRKLPKVKNFSPEREAKCKARISQAEKDGDVAGYLEDFRSAVRKAQDSEFMTGGNGWRASFDWFVDNHKNAYKVLEGNYDNAYHGPVNHTIRPADVGASTKDADLETLQFLEGQTALAPAQQLMLEKLRSKYPERETA